MLEVGRSVAIRQNEWHKPGSPRNRPSATGTMCATIGDRSHRLHQYDERRVVEQKPGNSHGIRARLGHHGQRHTQKGEDRRPGIYPARVAIGILTAEQCLADFDIASEIPRTPPPGHEADKGSEKQQASRHAPALRGIQVGDQSSSNRAHAGVPTPIRTSWVGAPPMRSPNRCGQACTYILRLATSCGRVLLRPTDRRSAAWQRPPTAAEAPKFNAKTVPRID